MLLTPPKTRLVAAPRCSRKIMVLFCTSVPVEGANGRGSTSAPFHRDCGANDVSIRPTVIFIPQRPRPRRRSELTNKGDARRAANQPAAAGTATSSSYFRRAHFHGGPSFLPTFHLGRRLFEISIPRSRFRHRRRRRLHVHEAVKSQSSSEYQSNDDRGSRKHLLR